jgi:GT2 family glycosyltransferase
LAGRPAEAAEHLHRGVAGDPFDPGAARALFQVLLDSGDATGARRLARDYRLLVQVAPQLVPAELWAFRAPPVGDELASVIVLCPNEGSHTRLCLESVLRHTRPPYDLVVMDNALTDAHPAYLDEVRARPGPARVEVLRCETSLGFPAGWSQALRQARGSYLVFLANDTVVTAGWLDGLIARALDDWPQVGLVGAVTNAGLPPQRVAVDYTTLEEMPAFAARRRQEYRGQAVPVERLAGFCLLARREVFDRVGGFGERLGPGLFDEDLSARAIKAGFQLRVALDVFVHHFDSRTFRVPSALQPPAEPHPAERISAPAGPAGEPALRVAVITIAHNEEDFIVPFLEHYFGLGVDTVFLVNNECTDQTVSRARRYANVIVTDLDSDGQLDDELRTATFERCRAACAGQYDFVIVVDADEFLVPKEGGLKACLGRHRTEPVLGSEGYEVIQRPDEPPYDPAVPLLSQRRWGFVSSSYNKPAVLRPDSEARLLVGQHCLLGPQPYPAVSPFYLLHLAAFDEAVFFKRRRQMVARQGARNIERGYGAHYTSPTEADLRRRWQALQGHPQQQRLPTTGGLAAPLAAD